MDCLELQPDHVQVIRKHGRSAFPHECCGFLLGQDQKGVRRIHRVVAAVNHRGEQQRHNRFTISPEAFLQAEKVARAEQLDVLGFYHSHPNAPASPSPYDLEHAWPVYSYVILSVSDGEPADLTCWILEDDRSRFNPQTITTAEDRPQNEEKRCLSK